jgi:hypothetical protein
VYPQFQWIMWTISDDKKTNPHGNSVRGDTGCLCNSRRPKVRRPAPRPSCGNRDLSQLTHVESNTRVAPQRDTVRPVIEWWARLASAQSGLVDIPASSAAKADGIAAARPSIDPRFLKSLQDNYGRLADYTLVYANLRSVPYFENTRSLEYDLRNSGPRLIQINEVTIDREFSVRQTDSSVGGIAS